MPSAPRNTSPNTALLRAARVGDGVAVRQALASGADTSHRNARGETAVLLACAARSSGAIEALIEAGASPIGDPMALDVLLQNGHVAVFERLLAANPHAFSPHLTLLRTAALHGHVSVVDAWPSTRPKDARVIWQMIEATDRTLTQVGADALWARFPVAPEQPVYRKLLDYGVRRGVLPSALLDRMDASEAMMPMPANISGFALPDSNGVPRRTPRVWEALAHGHMALAHRLLQRMKEAPTAWSESTPDFCKDLCMFAAEHASLPLVMAVGSLKGWTIEDLVALNGRGGTLLHAAVSRNSHPPRRTALVRFLIRNGADVEARAPTDDRTPLHEAAATARSGATTPLTVLDAAGASWAAVDKHGQTPLDLMTHQALKPKWAAILSSRALAGVMKTAQSPAKARRRF